MEPIKVAIEAADENLRPPSIRAEVERTCGVRITLSSEFANRMMLVVPESMDIAGEAFLPPVRLTALKAALARFGVTVATPSTAVDALSDPDSPHGEAINALRELRRLFREFKSNPLHDVELRGKEPADPVKRERKMRAKRFKAAFYDELATFIAKHPSLPYTAYWDADGRPRDKQWPEYRAAVKAAKDITTTTTTTTTTN